MGHKPNPDSDANCGGGRAPDPIANEQSSPAANGQSDSVSNEQSDRIAKEQSDRILEAHQTLEGFLRRVVAAAGLPATASEDLDHWLFEWCQKHQQKLEEVMTDAKSHGKDPAEALLAFLKGVARKSTKDRKRSFVRRKNTELLHARAQYSRQELGMAEAAAQLQERRERLWEAMASLSSVERETIVLFHIEGYSHQLIALLMGAPLGTVKSRLYSAKVKLGKELEDLL